MAILSVSTVSPQLQLPGFLLPSCAFSRSPTSSFPSQRPFQPLSSSSTALRLQRCHAATPDPPPPHNTDPPPGNDSTHLQDVAVSLSKIQDRVQIFFAVLFWMSLFFWASAWDGRNRPNKGSRFRK